MRLIIVSAGALAIGLAAAPALAAPEPLAFKVASEAYTVPPGGLASVATPEKEGLTFCLTPAVAADLTSFTERHRGETVEVAIGDTSVFHVKIVTPYDGGCISWPLHPQVAKAYRARLLGEPAQ